MKVSRPYIIKIVRKSCSVINFRLNHNVNFSMYYQKFFECKIQSRLNRIHKHIRRGNLRLLFYASYYIIIYMYTNVDKIWTNIEQNDFVKD